MKISFFLSFTFAMLFSVVSFAQNGIQITLVGGKQTTINISDVRHVMDGTSGAIIVAPNTLVATKTLTPMATILANGCSHLFQVTAADAQGKTKQVMLINKLYVKVITPTTGTNLAIITMRDITSNFYCNETYSAVSALVAACSGGGGGGGGAPTGPAGGDLTGTYPNPTLNPATTDDLTTTTTGMSITGGADAVLVPATINYNLVTGVGALATGAAAVPGTTSVVGSDGQKHLLPVATVSTTSPLTGTGAVATPVTFANGTAAGQVWQWNGTAWVLTSVSGLRKVENFSATANQTVFTIASSQPVPAGVSMPVAVFVNGVRLKYVAAAPTVEQFTYTGATVTLATGLLPGDVVTVEYFN